MIKLSFLITIPLIFISGIIIIASNYKLDYIPTGTNNLEYTAMLEESILKLPNILKKYYIYVKNVAQKIYSWLLSSSQWLNNIRYIKENFANENEEYKALILKKIGLFLSLVVFCLLACYWFNFSGVILSYQLVENWEKGDEISNFNIILGLDGVSLPFVLLIGYIIPIVYLSNWNSIDYKEAYYILIIVLLELFLLIVFLVVDLIMFYVFFESILPLLFLLVGLYGAAQKFRAGYYLFLYTLWGSLFMLLSFVKFGGDLASTLFENSGNNATVNIYEEITSLILFFAFSVKTPLVPVHIWLPLAHSDANLSGSIILASIVLKLALYGFIRILIMIIYTGTSIWVPYFSACCALSVLFASSTTMRQFDLKVIVAYSSIAHMASTLLGTFSNTLYGILGSIIFGLAHGFVSPGLFIIVGGIIYDRGGSRIINYFKGLSNLMPITAIVFLLFIFANMGVPLTANFIGEFLSLIGAYEQNIFIGTFGATSVILSAVYSIYLYNRTTSGSISPHIFTIPDIFRKEYFIIVPLLILTILLGIYPSIITSEIEFAISHCLLFSISPVILTRKDKDKNENEDEEKIEEEISNCNPPHNTPIVEKVFPPVSQSEKRDPSASINENPSPQSEQNQSDQNNGNESSEEAVGYPNSKEGKTPFVPWDDKKNQPVDSRDLNDKLVSTIYNKKASESDNEDDVWELIRKNKIAKNSNEGSGSDTSDDERDVPKSSKNCPDSDEKFASGPPKAKSAPELSSPPKPKSSPELESVYNSATSTESTLDTKNFPVEPQQQGQWIVDEEIDRTIRRLVERARLTPEERLQWDLEELRQRRQGDEIERNQEIESDNSNSEQVKSDNEGEGTGGSIKEKETKSENEGGRTGGSNKEEETKSGNQGEQINKNNINENNSNTNTYTISDNDSLNSFPKGDFIFINDYWVYVINFIHNNFIFDFSSITLTHILFLFVTFISYYRYYILCTSFKESFLQSYMFIKFWINNIFSYLRSITYSQESNKK